MTPQYICLLLCMVTFLFPSLCAASPPVITSEPRNQAVLPGATATFSVGVSGTPPLTFRWTKGGTVINGAAGPTLIITNVQPSDAGFYRVGVSNSEGSVLSQPAQLELQESYTLDLPAGYSLVANQLHTPGQAFPIPPNGTTTFKWNTASQQFQQYSFTTGSGWAPQEFTLAPGEGAVLFLPIAASLTFTGQRRPPVLPVPLAPGLNLVSAQTPAAATFRDIVGLPPAEGAVLFRYRSGDAMSVSHESYRPFVFHDGAWHDRPPLVDVGEAVWITVASPVQITKPPASQTVQPGADVVLTVEATGTGPLQYQWQLNGMNIPSATNDTLVVPKTTPRSSGLYSVVVENLLGATRSVPAAVRVLAPEFPFSDSFDKRPLIPLELQTLVTSNLNAGREPGEPAHGGHINGRSVWASWAAPAPGILTVSTRGSTFDTILAAYTGGKLNELVQVEVDDDFDQFGHSRIVFNVTPNTIYHIAVDSVGNTSGSVVLSWNFEPTPEMVPVILAGPQDVTARIGDPVRFSVFVPGGSEYQFQWFLDGQPLPGQTKPDLDISSAQPEHVGDYFVRVFGGTRIRQSRRAALQLNLPQIGSPVQDLQMKHKFFDLFLNGPIQSEKGPSKLGGSVARGYTGSQIFSTVGSGKEPGEPNHCGVTGGNSSWFAYQAETNGTIHINTDGSNFDTVLAVYVGPGTDFLTLTNVACDNNSGLDGSDSKTSFPATTGTIYWVAVDGVGGSSGTVRIKYQLVRPLFMTNMVYGATNNGRMVFAVRGTPNLATAVEATTNMVHWSALMTNTTVSGNFSFTNSNAAPLTNRFYRAVNRF